MGIRRDRRGWRSAALGALVFALSAGGALLVWHALSLDQHERIAEHVEMEADRATRELIARMEFRFLGLIRMGRRWERWGQPPPDSWEFEADLLLEQHPDLEAVSWLDDEGRVRGIRPLEGNEAALGMEPALEARRRAALERAGRAGEPALSRTIELMGGERGVVLFVPIREGERQGGHIAGVFRARPLFDNLLDPGSGFAAAVFDGAREVDRVPADAPDPDGTWLAERRFEVAGAPWRVQLWPTDLHLAHERSIMPRLFLLGGLLLAFVLAWLAYLTQRLRQRTSLLETFNRDLEREVAERRRAEKEAAARAQELHEVMESAQRFVRGLAHDLKNSIGAADGYAQLMEDGIPIALAPEQRGQVDGIRRSLRWAVALIDDMVELARAEAGQLPIRRKPTSLDRVIHAVVDEHRAGAIRGGLELEHGVDPDLPEVVTDRKRVHQILSNLVSNAVKYTPPGGLVGISAKHLSEDGGPGWVAVSVTDTGPGIEAAHHERIFEEFYRVDADRTEGAGLGLAISQRIARLLGGEIGVVSEPGAGSTFTLRLPVRREEGG